MTSEANFTLLAERIALPDATTALLWDMDGTLLDTLGLDFEICNGLIAERFPSGAKTVPQEVIKAYFAIEPYGFFRELLTYAVGAAAFDDRVLEQIVEVYEEARKTAVFKPCPGILEVLEAAEGRGFAQAVVSNNAAADVEQILSGAGIRRFFGQVVGNDHEGFAKKPAPDTYLLGAKRLAAAPEHCVVFEDSLLGAEAGKRAGCYTVAVATGGTPFAQLEASSWVDRAYYSFASADATLAGQR